MLHHLTAVFNAFGIAPFDTHDLIMINRSGGKVLVLTASLLEQEDDALEVLAGKAGRSLAGET